MGEQEYSADALKKAITANKGQKGGIDLLLKRGERYRKVSIAYNEGLKYPHLRKTGQGETGIDTLLQPQAGEN